MIQRRPRTPSINSTMTTAPTIQMIWFTARLLLLLNIILYTIARIPLRCASERSPDNPGGIDLDKPFDLSVNIRHVLVERDYATGVR